MPWLLTEYISIDFILRLAYLINHFLLENVITIYRVSQKKTWPLRLKNLIKSHCGAKNMVITWKYTFSYCFSGEKIKFWFSPFWGLFWRGSKKVLKKHAKKRGRYLICVSIVNFHAELLTSSKIIQNCTNFQDIFFTHYDFCHFVLF